MKFKRHYLLSVSVVLVALSCNSTKYVSDNESLLDRNYVKINRDNIKKSEIYPYIRQKPNKRIFGARFHLGLYNLSNIKKEKWPHNWLRNIGEEPVIFDQNSVDKSVEQIRAYLISKGYFDNKVLETIEIAKKHSKVFFDINLNAPYTVRNIIYDIQDTTIAKITYFDTMDCMIEKGKPYDVEILQAERARLERFIRDHGFYNFSAEHISFRIDSTIPGRQVDIIYSIRNFIRIGPDNKPVLVPHTQYKIRNIYILPDYNPHDFLAGGEIYQKNLDTTAYEGYYFVTSQKRPSISYNLLMQSIYLHPGYTFNQSNTERSHARLMSLKTYRLVNIFYNEVEEKPEDEWYRYLDCTIQLTPISRQSFSVELEGTNSGGNLGGALNFIYQNRNLLHGAEQFNLKLKGAYETFSQTTTGIKSTQEFGIETSLRLPKFLLPFLESENFIRKYTPSTTIQAAYNYQNLPVYTRTLANASFGYQWNQDAFRTHIVFPLQINFVKIPSIEEEYYRNIIEKSSYLINSYKDVLIAGGSYSYIFSRQKVRRSKDNWFFRFNAEASGNLLRIAMKLAGNKPVNDSISSSYNIFGQPFAQFVKADMDIRYNRIINDISSIVFRGFAGAGVPFKNSLAMPFEKQYFEGGANGIRGWQVRSLGPGSYSPPEAKYINQTGDIKLEANMEYRFKLFWILEGAVFVDAGNIWAIREDPDRPGAKFTFNKFYDDIAIGAGFGLRFDLKFVLLRTDLGFKFRDPKYTQNNRWIFTRTESTGNNTSLVIAIGYPF
ncbi:MAG: translocation and assembly module lipoprotein TamL [Bacteroidales bacterium]